MKFMSFFEILNPQSLYVSKCLFRAIGMTTNHRDRQFFLYVSTIIMASSWSAVLGAIFKAIMKIIHGQNFTFTDIGMLIWVIYTSFSYTFLYQQMNFGKNLFSFLETIPKPEANDYGKIRSPVYKSSNLETLNQISVRWIILSALFSVLATIASVVIFGPTTIVREMVPAFGNEADILYILLLFVSNVTCPIPMIIVRLGSYFTELRIVGMISYLETENEHLHAVPIASLMGWYDDVYRVNVQLENVISPYVTCALLVMLPQTVFLSQVIPLHTLKSEL
jgi:hypothetical protein